MEGDSLLGTLMFYERHIVNTADKNSPPKDNFSSEALV
jgi:hypothetical protein